MDITGFNRMRRLEEESNNATVNAQEPAVNPNARKNNAKKIGKDAVQYPENNILKEEYPENNILKEE